MVRIVSSSTMRVYSPKEDCKQELYCCYTSQQLCQTSGESKARLEALIGAGAGALLGLTTSSGH